MITYQSIIVLSWIAFLVVWAVLAFNVKRDVSGGYASFWRQYWQLRVIAALLIVFAVVRMATGKAHYAAQRTVFTEFIFHPSLVLGFAGAALAVIGIAIAIWARLYLGRNWSPVPAVKERHELVTSGPYAYVRHPIYTGAILAAFGTALSGTVFGAIVFVAASVMFTSRIGREEKIMLGLFPAEYPAYRARTKRLIPFVW